MKRTRIAVILLALGGLALLSAAAAQVDANKAATLKQAPSKLVFKVSRKLPLKAGQPAAYNLCANGAPVAIPGAKKDVNWNQLQADIDQKQCGGPFGTQASSISGGDGGPYTFQLDTGSFPPLGMHLGLNGMLYGTPTPHKNHLLSQGPFRVCAVELGGEPSCSEVPVAGVGSSGLMSHKRLLAATAVGGAGVVGTAMAASSMSNMSSSGGGSCTMSAPVECGVFGPGDPPGCVAGSAFVSALQSYCSCYGFPSGYSLGAGISCP